MPAEQQTEKEKKQYFSLFSLKNWGITIEKSITHLNQSY